MARRRRFQYRSAITAHAMPNDYAELTLLAQVRALARNLPMGTALIRIDRAISLSMLLLGPVLLWPYGILFLYALSTTSRAFNSVFTISIGLLVGLAIAWGCALMARRLPPSRTPLAILLRVPIYAFVVFVLWQLWMVGPLLPYLPKLLFG
jgi:hypothetical protein